MTVLTAPASGDKFEIVDVSDTTDNPNGSSRQVTATDVITKAHGLTDGLVKVATGTMAVATAGTDYSTPSSTDTLTNKTFNANGTGNSLSNVEVADMAATAVVTAAEGLASSDNDTSIPTTAAVIDGLATKQDSGATLASLEGLTLGAGDMLYATAADTLTDLAIGTAGQVLQVNAGATAPEWTTPAASGGNTRAYVDWSTASKMDASGSNGTLTVGSSGAGASVNHGVGLWDVIGPASVTGYAQLWWATDRATTVSDANKIYDINPEFWMMIASNAKNWGASDFKGYWGLGGSSTPATSFTNNKSFGFEYDYLKSGSDVLNAINCDGTTVTRTAVTAPTDFDDAATTYKFVRFAAKMTSGTNIKFYGGGSLLATHTTNLPSGVRSGLIEGAVQISKTVAVSAEPHLCFKGGGYYFDLY